MTLLGWILTHPTVTVEFVSHEAEAERDDIARLRQSIGATIRYRRVQAGLSQETLAQEVGLSRKLLNRIENAHVSPRLDSLLLVASGLKITLSELVEEPEDPEYLERRVLDPHRS